MAPKKSQSFLLLCGATLLLIMYVSFGLPQPAAAAVQQSKYQVLSVIDGDTIVVERIGKVRYLGINTPELHHPSKGSEYYSQEALTANRQLVAGKKVRLDYDIQRSDKYGRTLAYVYVGKMFVNAKLVADGFARAMPIRPNLKHARYLYRLQHAAQAAEKGIWQVRFKSSPNVPKSVTK